MPNPESHKRWCRDNPEKLREYALRCSRKESSKEKAKAWKFANKERVLAAGRRYLEKNRDKRREACKKWRDSHRNYINEMERKRCAEDPSYKLARNLRNQLTSKIKNHRAGKITSAMKLLGCELDFLMGYLEALFKPGMKWSNYGSVWEIDHKVPCASYDLTDESHQRSCFHYTNLQPLFVIENRKKWAKIETPIATNTE